MSNEGARLLAIKFVEKTVLLYTPDLDTPPDPPIEVTEGITYTAFHTPPPPKKKTFANILELCHDGLSSVNPFVDMGFNVAWLRGGHPLLNVGDLAMEASQNLGLLLEQLKPPKVKSLSTSMIIVFVTRFVSSICVPLSFLYITFLTILGTNIFPV